MIRKFVSVCLLALFIPYSGGIGYLMQTCDHCNKIKIYFILQPECCSNSHTTEQEEENTCNDTGDVSCCHKEHNDDDKVPETSPEIYTNQTKQCCMFEYVYFKINASYLSASCDKIIQANTDHCNILFDLLWEEGKPLLHEKFEDKILPEKIPPLIPGGERFIIYSHQLLFYA
jgi:hypothetical protein